MHLGIEGFFVLVAMAVFWVVPIAAAAWALWTLHRIRTAQTNMQAKLDAIEHRLPSTSDPHAEP